MSQKSIDPINNFAKVVGIDVCQKLGDETGREWRYETKSDFLDYHITYLTNGFKTTSSWSVFDARPSINSGKDPLGYIEEIVNIDYNQVISLYKKSFGEVNEDKNDTGQGGDKQAKRNIKGSRKLSKTRTKSRD